jgi:hypothetical protein
MPRNSLSLHKILGFLKTLRLRVANALAAIPDRRGGGRESGQPKIPAPVEPIGRAPSESLNTEKVEKRAERDGAGERVKAKPAKTVTKSPAEPKAPACPFCKKTMVLKVARSGANAGGNFWGCADYPKCRGIRPIFAPMKVR